MKPDIKKGRISGATLVKKWIQISTVYLPTLGGPTLPGPALDFGASMLAGAGEIGDNPARQKLNEC